ncbi:MAG TPA: polyprenol monophosphomannose synthase [Solirubrobacterales bacterium]|nr:polyprenol monophosphomannose synthase [Solirubrobacterales bacterium]
MEASPAGLNDSGQAAVALGTSAIWLVMPTYNEALNIEPIVEAAREHLPPGSRILIVDDNSPDGTGQVADRLAAEDDHVEVLHRTKKEGIGPAYVAGFNRAIAGGADLVAQMDSDFSHDPAELPLLIAAADDADVVLGSRYVEGGEVSDWGALRRSVSRGGSVYARLVLGLPIRDLTGGFKVLRRAVLERIDLGSISSAGYAFQVEVTYRAARRGFRIDEIPIHFRDRRAGKSKMSGLILAEAAIGVPRMRVRDF